MWGRGSVWWDGLSLVTGRRCRRPETWHGLKVFTISLPEILHRRAALRLVPPPTAHACTGTLAAAQQSKHVFGQDTVFRTCRFCVVVAPQLEWSATREESLVEGDGERTVWRWHARARSEDDSGYETP